MSNFSFRLLGKPQLVVVFRHLPFWSSTIELACNPANWRRRGEGPISWSSLSARLRILGRDPQRRPFSNARDTGRRVDLSPNWEESRRGVRRPAERGGISLGGSTEPA